MASVCILVDFIMRVDKLARLGLTYATLDNDSEDYLKGVIANPQRC
jgi:hypothetical protein